MSKYNWITPTISAIALICSLSGLYFQFFHKYYDVRASLINSRSDNEKYVYDIAFTNGGNQNIIITELGRCGHVNGKDYPQSNFYDPYYMDTNIESFILRPGDVSIKTISFPFKLRKDIKGLRKEGIVVVEFGVVIVAMDTNGNLYRNDLIIPEARDFSSKIAIGDPGRSPPSVSIVTPMTIVE